MSENTFPFAGGEEPVAFVEETEGERNQKALLVAGGLVAALVLGAVGYLFLGAGGDDEETFTPVKRAPRVAAAAPKEVVRLPSPYREQIGRDPFRALYLAPASGSGGGAPVAAGAPPAPAPVVGTTGGPAIVGSTGDGAGSNGATPAPAPARYVLKLLSIDQPNGEVRTSTWTVDSKRETVLPAQRFGKYGELVVLAYTKNDKGVVDGAVLQVGDDSPMEVKVGESNTVL